MTDVAIVTKADREAAVQLKYLQNHHHITESMIGIMLLHATPRQKKAVQYYADELELLHINRLLDCGVEVENIGERGIFVHSDHLVEQAVAARAALGQSLPEEMS